MQEVTGFGDSASFTGNSHTASLVPRCTPDRLSSYLTARPSPQQLAPGQESSGSWALPTQRPGTVSSWMRSQASSSISLPCVMGTSELILCVFRRPKLNKGSSLPFLPPVSDNMDSEEWAGWVRKVHLQLRKGGVLQQHNPSTSLADYKTLQP